jgi:hypothetical protein
MKNIWILLLFLGQACFAQTLYSYDYYLPWDKIVSKNGYCDLRGGNYEDEPRFDKLFSWNGKTAHVCRDNKMGVINGTTGEIIIPVKYPFIGAPDDGYFIFKSDTNGRFGVMNEKGELVIPPKYYRLAQINDKKLCFMSDNTIGLMGLDQNIHLSYPTKNASHAVINQLGFYQNFSGLIHSYHLPVGQYMIAYGDRILVPEFDRDKEFSVLLSDLKGNQLSKEYDDILYLSETYFAFKKGDFYGVLDINGKVIIPSDYTRIQLLDNNDFLLKTKEGAYVLKGANGDIKFNTSYCMALNNNRFLVQRNGLFGMINRKKDTLLPFNFKKVVVYDANCLQVQFNRFEFGLPTSLPRTQVSYSYYLMDSLGVSLSDTMHASHVYTFDNEGLDLLSSLPVLPKWGNYSKNHNSLENKSYKVFSVNRELSPFRYYQSKPLEGVLDSKGDTLVDAKKYHFVRGINPSTFIVKNRKGKAGVMNSSGKIIVDFKYDSFQTDACGILAYIEKEYHFFDFDGKKVFELDVSSGEHIFFNEYGTLIYKNEIFPKNK